MQRTSLSLPDDVAAALKREAQRRRQPVSELAREAIVNHLGLAPGERQAVPYANLGGSGATTSNAENAEEILAREWHAYIRGR